MKRIIIAEELILNGDTIEEVIDEKISELAIAPGVGISITDEEGSKVISATGTPSSNPFKATTIESFGGIANYVAVGTTMTGTDNSPALAAAISAAGDGQLVIIPHGNWYFASKITIATTRRVRLMCFGNCYAPLGLLNFTATGTRKHLLHFYGANIGKLGLSSETKTDFTNSTNMYAASGTNYDSLTATFIDITDVTQVDVLVNVAEGWLQPVSITTGTVAFGGVQEVNVQGGWWLRNKYGIRVKSTAGTSYGDKNVFSGINGGCLRIGGYQAIFLDGYSNETAAMYNNKFYNILFEGCGYGLKMTGYAHSTLFNGCSWESGTNTGTWSGDYINIANAPSVGGGKSPIGTTFEGCEFMFLDWFTNCGIGTTIHGTLYVRNPSNFNQQVFVGNLAVGGAAGRLTVFGSSALTPTERGWLPANIDYIQFINTTDPTTDGMLVRKNGVERIVKYGGGGSGIPQVDAATLLATPINGRLENDGDDFYNTNSSTRSKFLDTGNIAQFQSQLTGEHFNAPDANYTFTQSVRKVYFAATTGTRDAILPTAATSVHAERWIKNAGSGSVAVKDGGTTITTLTAGQSCFVVSNGTTWLIYFKG